MTSNVNLMYFAIQLFINDTGVLMERDTRLQLIESGVDAMLRKGYQGVGINEVLRTVGVPKGSFYYYFKSKEDFGVSVIQHYAACQLQLMQALLLDSSVNARTRLMNYYSKMKEYYAQDGFSTGCLVINLGGEISSFSEPLAKAIRKATVAFYELITDCIREGKRRDDIDLDEESATIAAFVNNAWEGAVMKMQIEKSPAPLDNFMDYIFFWLIP